MIIGFILSAKLTAGLIMAAQMIAALTILVTIHEWGHYITGKMFGVRVDKFFVFFDAWGKKLFSIKKGETEYGVGWLPLGGYVKLAGMIDESMDKDWEEVPVENQFRFKPAWQKLIIMLAGIFMNVVLGVSIFIGMHLMNKNFLPLEKLNSNYIVSSYGEEVGLQQGDEIVGANGKDLHRMKDIDYSLAFGGTLNVKRDGEVIPLTVDENYFQKPESIFYYKSNLSIEQVSPGSNAEKAGLQKGDHIVSVNGDEFQAVEQFITALSQHTGESVALGVLRNGQEKKIDVKVDEEGKIGFLMNSQIDESYNTAFRRMNFGEAVKYGVKDAFNLIFLNAKAFGKMGQGKIKAKDSLAGPIQIAQLFGAKWNWARFWSLTAALSMILAFMNLLPIPALDGGHAVFAIIEMITGKPVNEKVLETAQIIGFVLLMALMVFILGNDIIKTIM